MAERATVEVLINAFTEAAEDAIGDVGDTLNGMTADAAPAQAAVDEVGDELNDVTESGAVAQAALNEVGDEAASAAARNRILASQIDRAGDDMTTTAAKAGVLSGAYSRVSASAGGLTVSTGALSAVTTASLIPAMFTLSTALLPLAGIMAAAAAAAGSLVAVFGGLTAIGAATHMKELQAAFKEAKKAITEIIQPLGDVFGPLLVDAVQALPALVQNIMDAIGPLDQFKQAFRELGQRAFQVIPDLVAAMVELATVALPVFMDLVDFLINNVGPAFDRVRQTTQEFAPAIMELGAAVGDLLPDLYRIGEIVLSLVLPALTDIINVIDSVAEFVLGLDENLRRLAVAGAITAPAIFSVASSLGALLGPIGLAAAAVTAFVAAYRSNFMGVQDITDSVIGDVIDYFSQFSDEVTEYLDAVQESVEAFTGGLSDGFGDTEGPAGDLLANLQGLGSQLRDVGSIIASTLVPLFHRVIDTVASARGQFRELGRNVTRIVNGIVSVVRGIVSVFQFVFENYTAQVLEGMTSLFETHFGSILSEVNQTLTAVMGYVNWFAGVFGAAWSEWGDEIMAVARVVFDVLSATIITAMDALLTTINVILNVIQGDWGEAWEAVVGLFERVSERLTSMVEDWNLGQVISDVWSAVVSVSLDFVRGFSSLIMDAFTSVMAFFDVVTNTIFNMFADMWNAISSNAIRAVEGLIDTVVDGVNAVIDRANSLIREINSKVPKVNISTIDSLQSADLNEQALQIDQRSTNFSQLQGQRESQLSGVLELAVQGDGPLSEFVQQNADDQVQVAEDDRRRVLRRQGIGGPGVSSTR
jgi:phage-related protein